MAKILVEDAEDHTRVPFLRGILIRSLQDAGAPFGDAFAIASDIRNELAEAVISTHAGQVLSYKPAAEDTDLSGLGLDAILTTTYTILLEFSSATEADAEIDINVTCAGTQCTEAEAASGATYPCDSTVAAPASQQ